ncbi:MAG TPA: PHB depolymerase family esterase [Gemmataceae bacterium]
MSATVRPQRWFLAILLLPIMAAPARAEEKKYAVVFLKDGFVLQGEVQRKTTILFDGGQLIPIKEGFFMIDDGVRRIVFSPDLVKDVDDKKPPEEETFQSLRGMFYPAGVKVPVVRKLFSADPFDGSWLRNLHMEIEVEGEVKGDTKKVNVKLQQHLSQMTSHGVRIDATKLPISTFYLTRELGPEMVAQLLANHPDLKDTPASRQKPLPVVVSGAIGQLAGATRGQGPLLAAASVLANQPTESAEWHFRLYRFYAQAGWLEQAEAELEFIANHYSEKVSEVETARGTIKELRVRQLMEALEDAQAAGQHRLVKRVLDSMPTTGLSEKVVAQSQALRLKYEDAGKNLEQTRRFLKELQSAKPAPPEWMAAAASAMREEMPDDLFLKINEGDPPCRLEAFRTQAEQAERQRAPGKAPDLGPEQLLALAVTGWLMGNTAAEAKPEAAKRLWEARQFVLKYQNTEDAKDREKLLKEFKKDGDVPTDEMAQLLQLLPPPELEENVTTKPMELQTRSPGKRGKGVTYWLQAPPEYTPGRSYPVLLALHTSGEKAKDIFERFQPLAARHGFLLVAPEWAKDALFDADAGYTYSAEEHAAVLDVLRDVRRRFQVDSDRVFLFGFGQGANMAYDVGLAHPDLFAGVIPMSGAPFYQAERCWHNAQFLPFYVICGDHGGDYHRANYAEFRKWVPRNYPVLYVMYKGRRVEWFDGELPYVFDWMKRQKRANPLVRLGTDGSGGPFGDEFGTMRSGDNRFYWLTTDAIDKHNRIEGGEWKGSVSPATLFAQIRENQVVAKVTGINQLTVWLSPGQVDYDKPVSVWVNRREYKRAAKVTPSIDVMLEDFQVRGDRQRLYVVKLPLDLTK